MIDVGQAQDRDRNIVRIKDIMKSQRTITFKERENETPEVKRFLFELPKLHIDPKSAFCIIDLKLLSQRNYRDACLKNYTKIWVT